MGLEARHIELARAVSAVARSHGAPADRASVQEVQLAISAKPDAIDVGFWRAVLGYDPMADDNGVDPLGHGSTVWMQELDPDKPLRHAMHVDVSVAREQAEARLAAALAAGGPIVRRVAAPAAWILADRAGNKVCIAAWPDGSVLRPTTRTAKARQRHLTEKPASARGASDLAEDLRGRIGVALSGEGGLVDQIVLFPGRLAGFTVAFPARLATVVTGRRFRIGRVRRPRQRSFDPGQKGHRSLLGGRCLPEQRAPGQL